MITLEVPTAIRLALEAHAAREAPLEACGLLEFAGGRVCSYYPGVNGSPTPHERFELMVEPELWASLAFVGVFHSHPGDVIAAPSRSDVDSVGLFEGRPYLIHGADGLRGWVIRAAHAFELELS